MTSTADAQPFMYRLTITLCVTGAIVTVVSLAHLLPTITVVLLLGSPEFLVYGVIGGFAYLCRDNVRGSSLVLVMGLSALLLSAAIIATASKPISWATAVFVWSYEFGQAVIAVVGCYFGYMFVERQRLQQQKCNSSTGKLVAIILLVPVAALAAVLLVLAW